MKNIYEPPKSDVDNYKESQGSVVLGLLLGVVFHIVFPILFSASYTMVYIFYKEKRGHDLDEAIQDLFTGYMSLSVSLVVGILFAWCGGYFCSKIVKLRKYLWVTVLLSISILIDRAISYLMPEEFSITPVWYVITATLFCIVFTYVGAHSWKKTS